MSRAIKLNAAQEAQFRRMWLAGVAVIDLRDSFGLTADAIHRLRKMFGLPARTARTRGYRQQPYKDPTPDEIAQRVLEVQSRWTPEIEQRRRVGQPFAPQPKQSIPDSTFPLGGDRD